MRNRGLPLVVSFLLFGSAACVERSNYATIDEHQKVAEHILPTAPEKMDGRLDARFEDKVVLLGYDLSARSVAPGETVQITWYWKCLAPTGPGWRLFTHVFDADEKPRLNQDKVGPIRSSFQPEHWKPGMIVRDVQRIEVPMDWSSPVFEPRLGLWRRDDRMTPVSGPDGGNRRVRGPKLAVLVVQASRVDVPFALHKPILDGVVSGDPAWQRAAVIGANLQTMTGAELDTITEIRLLWDDDNLYVAMSAQDDFIHSEYTKHDDELWHADAFEVFLDPEGDQKDYYEIQVNPAGVIFDSHLPTYRKNRNEWSSLAVARTTIDGDLNAEEMKDAGWRAELAIPWAGMVGEAGRSKLEGSKWRANFFRVDKTKEKSRAGAWSPPLRGDFHALDRFGELTLIGRNSAGGDHEPDTATDLL